MTVPRSLSVLALAALCLAPVACQKQNIKVKGHDLKTIIEADRAKSFGVPIDLPGALGAARDFIQSRGVINLSINSDQVSTSSPLELVNATTGFSLIKAPAGAFGLADGDSLDDPSAGSWSLASKGYEFKLAIYPLDPNFVGKFAYGENKLNLNVGDKTAPKDAKHKIAMVDFAYLAPASALFSSNDQQLEGFQGEMITVTGPFGSNESYELATGSIGILNR